ncbi:hypothetical protein [Parasphingorhabdus sp.]|uniref:hypothetical protein n=1 Tax=Parasphingorhabdus sp. TaxID=2709688 RepID=UPI0030025341
MKRHIAMLAGISLLAACQAEERGADGSGQPMAENTDTMNDAANSANSDEILAKKSLAGMDQAGADIDPTDGKNDELNQDITLPAKSRYATYYLGSYAPKGQCAGSEQYLELDQAKVTYGETACMIKGITGDGSSLTVSLNQCKAEGQNASDRSYRLDLPKMDQLKLSGAANADLVRCGSKG